MHTTYNIFVKDGSHPCFLASASQKLTINGKEFPIDKSVSSALIPEIQRKLSGMSEKCKIIFASLLSLHSNKGNLFTFTIEEALKDVKVLGQAAQVDIFFDESLNTICLENHVWKFQMQAVCHTGESASGTLTCKESGDTWACSTSNTSYEKMVELMKYLSLLSANDQKKLVETLNLDEPRFTWDIIKAIDVLALTPESESKELQQLVLTKLEETRKIKQEKLALLAKRIEGKVKFSDLEKHIDDEYAFPVYDWDKNRGGKEPAGILLIQKVAFDERGHEGALNAGREFGCNSLKGLTVEQMGELFNRIFQKCEHCIIKGTPYTATSMHLRLGEGDTIPDQPFLFILGYPLRG